MMALLTLPNAFISRQITYGSENLSPFLVPAALQDLLVHILCYLSVTADIATK